MGRVQGRHKATQSSTKMYAAHLLWQIQHTQHCDVSSTVFALGDIVW